MANETAKAAKERINMGFKSPLDDAKPETIIKHFFLVAGDFNGRGVKDNGTLSTREPIDIPNASELKNLFNNQKICLNLKVDNKLSDGDSQKEDQLEVNLELKVDENEQNCLLAFRPEKIAEQVNEIREAMIKRRNIMELRTLLRKPDFARAISEILPNEELTLHTLNILLERYERNKINSSQ